MTTADDPVHLAPSGEVHVRFRGPGSPVVLPRPTFGQIKRLIRQQGLTADRLEAASHVALAERTRLLNGREGETLSKQNVGDLEQIRVEMRVAADTMQDETEQAVAEWWRIVFEILEVPLPNEDDWPSQFINTLLPNLMVNHWRFVPVGPG